MLLAKNHLKCGMFSPLPDFHAYLPRASTLYGGGGNKTPFTQTPTKSNFTQKVSKSTFGGKKLLFSKVSKSPKVSKVFFLHFWLAKNPYFDDAERQKKPLLSQIWVKSVSISPPPGAIISSAFELQILKILSS